jgi:uncharacterized protein YeaO (DUF488 family)
LPQTHEFDLFTDSGAAGMIRSHERPGNDIRVRDLPLSPAATLVFLEKPMTIRIVRLGTPRSAGEGTRLGTVRRPPRGVPKAEFSKLDWYDVWFPVLAPSAALMKVAQAAESDKHWAGFFRKYRAEMASPAASQSLDVLAALSSHAQFSMGCYCADEQRCHRSQLRALLLERGAEVE